MLEAIAWPAKGHKYAFLSFLTASVGRAYMRNPSGILGHRVCPGHCILPSASLCFESVQIILNGKPGVKLACIYMQIGSGSSVVLMTRIWHALKGRSWPGILFMILQTGLWPIKFPHLDIFAARAGRSCKTHSFANMDITNSFPTQCQIWHLERVDLAESNQ